MKPDSRKTPKKRPRTKAPRFPWERWLTAALVVLSLLFAAVYVLWPEPEAPGRLNQNPYGPGDFALVDGYMTPTAGKLRQGLDVSYYQEDIDWEAVHAAGFDFVFVRLGNRGYRTGSIEEDVRWEENLTGAKAAGLEVGAYFYSQAISTQEASEEALWCLKLLSGRKLDLPLVFDWEWVGPEARTGAMGREEVTACAQTFCDTIAAGGYEPMIYFNPHVGQDLLDLEALEDYQWWLAMYREEMNYPHRVDFWQYTEKGTVPGIEGYVDIDLMLLP